MYVGSCRSERFGLNVFGVMPVAEMMKGTIVTVFNFQSVFISCDSGMYFSIFSSCLFVILSFGVLISITYVCLSVLLVSTMSGLLLMIVRSVPVYLNFTVFQYWLHLHFKPDHRSFPSRETRVSL
mgnify:CR=1 FL=1